MRYIKCVKVFMLLAVVALFASCSDDDKSTNTNECTVGFESTALTVNETDGYVEVPITVSGLRNGNVRVNILAEPAGAAPAVEGEDYLITDKTLNLNVDTLQSTTLNVEVKVLDNSEIDGDRQFTLTLTDVEGAQVTNSQVTITIEDNDDVLYERFFGTWVLSATDAFTGSSVSKEITISGPNSPSNPFYESYLFGSSVNLLSQNETLEWNFQYNYDEATNSGTLAIVCNEPIGEVTFTDASNNSVVEPASWAGLYDMMQGGQMGTFIDYSPYVGTWSIGEDGVTISEIVFPTDMDLGIISTSLMTIGARYHHVTLTKKQ